MKRYIFVNVFGVIDPLIEEEIFFIKKNNISEYTKKK